ncbi:MAG: molybdenum cofactor guanylyltransferase [Acidimicrobiales bacterium]
MSRPSSRRGTQVVLTGEGPPAPTAGIVLTGGRSRRMGMDKATLVVGGVPCAVRVATVLTGVAGPLVEVGPGHTGLPRATEEHPGEGPLAALVDGARALAALGYVGGALVVACDLPAVTPAALSMLTSWPSDRTVVPVVAGRPQTLCARWSADALDQAAGLVVAGERSVRSLLTHLDPGAVVLLDETRWPIAVDASAFTDVDTPEDLNRISSGNEGATDG